MLNKRVREDIKDLTYGYAVKVSEDYLVISNFKLPEGYNKNEIEILLYPPKDYPISHPGVGSSNVYIPNDVLYHEKEISDFHPNVNPKWGNWAWLCFREIKWNPLKDNLLTFFELVRLHLTNLEIKKPVSTYHRE